MFNDFKTDFFAQGTIEYLVIVGVVVVLSLVVVGLMVNLGSASSQQIFGGSEKLGSVGSGGIIITQAVGDNETGLLVLGNHSGGDLSLTRIRVDENSYDYDDEFIAFVGERMVDVRDLCVCGKGETKKTCEFEFIYLTQSGLEKKQKISVTITCTNKVSVREGTN